MDKVMICRKCKTEVPAFECESPCLKIPTVMWHCTNCGLIDWHSLVDLKPNPNDTGKGILEIEINN